VRGEGGREAGREEGEGSFRFGTELRWALILVSLSPVNLIQFNSMGWGDKSIAQLLR
jgi:hypothetical protein